MISYCGDSHNFGCSGFDSNSTVLSSVFEEIRTFLDLDTESTKRQCIFYFHTLTKLVVYRGYFFYGGGADQRKIPRSTSQAYLESKVRLG